jgi:hypothetical protein
MHHHLKTPNSIIHVIRTKVIYEHKSSFTYTNENFWISKTVLSKYILSITPSCNIIA